MQGLFKSESSKGGVVTHVFGHFEKSNAFANNREMSKEELIRLHKTTLEKKSKLKPKTK